MAQSPKTFVLSSSLTGAADLIYDLGGRPAQLAKEAGLPPEALEDPDLLISALSTIRFFEHAALQCKCRHFGLLLAERGGWQTLGPIWLVMRKAKSIRIALTDLAENFELITSAISSSLEADPEGLAFCYEPRAGLGSSAVQIVEMGLALGALEICRIAGAGWHPLAVQFRHPAPRSMKMHKKIFGPHVSFEQDRNAIVLDTETLDLPMEASRGRGHDLLAASLREPRSRDANIEEHRVEAAIRALLTQSQCDLSTVAELLGMSDRSLQHHLHERGHSFQKILDSVRIDLARKYLVQSGLRVSQIAELLQYSETATFSRFVKKHLSASPREVRNQGSESGEA